MSRTIIITEADIQALRVAQFTLKTGDPADDRAAAQAFERLLGGLGIERKAEPLAGIESPVSVTVHNHVGDAMPHGDDAVMNVLRSNAPRRGRPRKRAA